MLKPAHQEQDEVDGLGETGRWYIVCHLAGLKVSTQPHCGGRGDRLLFGPPFLLVSVMCPRFHKLRACWYRLLRRNHLPCQLTDSFMPSVCICEYSLVCSSDLPLGTVNTVIGKQVHETYTLIRKNNPQVNWTVTCALRTLQRVAGARRVGRSNVASDLLFKEGFREEVTVKPK